MPPALLKHDGRERRAIKIVASLRDWIAFVGGDPDKEQVELIRSLLALEDCMERQLARSQDRDAVSIHFTRTHLAWRNAHQRLMRALTDTLGRKPPGNRPAGILKQMEGTAA